MENAQNSIFIFSLIQQTYQAHRYFLVNILIDVQCPWYELIRIVCCYLKFSKNQITFDSTGKIIARLYQIIQLFMDCESTIKMKVKLKINIRMSDCICQVNVLSLVFSQSNE